MLYTSKNVMLSGWHDIKTQKYEIINVVCIKLHKKIYKKPKIWTLGFLDLDFSKT